MVYSEKEKKQTPQPSIFNSFVDGTLEIPSDAKFSKRQVKDSNSFTDEIKNLPLIGKIEKKRYQKGYFSKILSNLRITKLEELQVYDKSFEELLSLKQNAKRLHEQIQTENLQENEKEELTKKLQIAQQEIFKKGSQIKDALNLYMDELEKKMKKKILDNTFSFLDSSAYKEINSSTLTDQEKERAKKEFNKTINDKKLQLIYRTFLCSGNMLFHHEPCFEDINQTDLEDCYLLAALMSLINSDNEEYGPKFIMNMMKYNPDDYTVTVRLHKIKFDGNGDFKSAEPRYYKVNSAVLPYNTYSTLWVNVIEKAYAIGGFSKLTEKIRASIDPKSKEYYKIEKKRVRSIIDINTGSAAFALMVLTGKRASCFFDKADYDKNPFNYQISSVKDKFNFIKYHLEKKIPITCGFKNDFLLEDETKVSCKHEYAIINLDDSNKNVILINSHRKAMDKETNKKKAIIIPEPQFLENLDAISVLGYPDV